MDRDVTENFGYTTPEDGATFVLPEQHPEISPLQRAREAALSTETLRGGLGLTATGEYDTSRLAFSAEPKPEVPESPEVQAYRAARQAGALITCVRELEQALPPEMTHIYRHASGV